MKGKLPNRIQRTREKQEARDKLNVPVQFDNYVASLNDKDLNMLAHYYASLCEDASPELDEQRIVWQARLSIMEEEQNNRK